MPERWETRAALWVGGLAAALLVGAVLVVWLVFHAGETEPVPWQKPAKIDGDLVQLTYLGSECRDGASVDVDEYPDEVTLTIEEMVHGRSCSDVGVVYAVDVRLNALLGNRELVDGACLLEELARRSACR